MTGARARMRLVPGRASDTSAVVDQPLKDQIPFAATEHPDVVSPIYEQAAGKLTLVSVPGSRAGVVGRVINLADLPVVDESALSQGAEELIGSALFEVKASLKYFGKSAHAAASSTVGESGEARASAIGPDIAGSSVDAQVPGMTWIMTPGFSHVELRAGPQGLDWRYVSPAGEVKNIARVDDPLGWRLVVNLTGKEPFELRMSSDSNWAAKVLRIAEEAEVA